MTEAHPPAAPPCVASPPSPSTACNLAFDVYRAESILFDLAGELRRVPFHAALRIHLRALQLKRLITPWTEESPDDATRHAVIDELLALQRDVEALRPRVAPTYAISVA
ncbi:MAG: hypothetical protein ACLQVI_42360 [Polyangiaceae bacterium]|jgi:hypothetical protein